ncbi:peptidoglycan-binding domain-containing protein [Streptomyces sp. NBC_01304]|uniref:peptidoglycan-binding domain-containing protein n=1 Tax=Streptomyces sp. NBC_01304 TaxID=2903818 RepID=UPI002E151C69|nr:peptidoglycan-binding protein [Streptomyces sp. NBC_01304]
MARLQSLLYDQGKTYLIQDGHYDSDTERAVHEYQQENGITGDPAGAYGPATQAALDPTS